MSFLFYCGASDKEWIDFALTSGSLLFALLLSSPLLRLHVTTPVRGTPVVSSGTIVMQIIINELLAQKSPVSDVNAENKGCPLL